MKRRPLRLALLASALLVFARAARADDVPAPAHPSSEPADTTELQGLLNETVVTTASKAAETSTTAPATSTTLTAEDMRRYGIRTIDEAIDFLSLGVVTANPLSSPEVGGRGVLISNDFGNHFLLLVDNHAVNEPLFGGARFGRGVGIPMEMVDHIEVILGPGSVLYGSNAMLGVINVITKRAKDWQGAHVAIEGDGGKLQRDTAHLASLPDDVRSKLDGWKTSDTLGLLSWRAMGGAGYEVPLLGRTLEVVGGVEYFQQDGPAFTFGPQNGGIDQASNEPVRYVRPSVGPATGLWGGIASHSNFVREPGAQLRLAWGDFELSAHASAFKRGIPYRARFLRQITDFDDPDGFELDRRAWVDLRHRATLSSIAQLTTRVYGDTWDYQNTQNSSEASTCIGLPITGEMCSYQTRAASRWVGIEVQASLDWLKDASLVTLLGVDERARFMGSKIDVRDFDTGAPVASSFGVIDRRDETLGAYVQQTWTPAPWLGLNAGARLDEETRYRGNVSPRLAATAGAWRGGTLKAVYAEAFRAPSWFESDFTSPITIRNPNLRPERVRSIEGSIEQRYGTQRLLFGAFRSWWTDLVDLHLLTPEEAIDAARAGLYTGLRYNGVLQSRNVSSIANYGFNGAYEGSAGDSQQLRWGATVTGSIAQRSEPCAGANVTCAPAQPLVVGPQVFGNLRVAYDLPGVLPTIALAAHWMGKRYADRAFVGGWPTLPVAPEQFELRATVSGDVPGVRGLSYRVGANWAAVDHGPYVVGPIQDRTAGDRAQLVPVDTFRAMAGLQYDWLP